MNAREYEAAMLAEVEQWPGASIRFEDGGKHPRAVFAFGEAEQFRPYPASGSDGARGLANMRADMRRILREMGAQRVERPKSTRPPSERNPGADMRELPGGEPAPVRPDPWAALRAEAEKPLITAPGAYPDIPNDAYHGREICPGPSISSTGLKKLVGHLGLQTKGCTPRHYWESSPLNPDRKPQEQTDALRLGSAFHDALLLPERWADPACYHTTPDGFSRAKSKAMAVEIAEEDAAAAAGLTIVSYDERLEIDGMVAATRANPLVDAVLSHGQAEVTLAWQDAETGVWVRARPDWLLDSRRYGINVKTAADASYAGFQSDVTKYRYYMSAALELDAIEQVFGTRPGNYLHPVIEKPGKGWQSGDYLPVALWELPAEDIAYGRDLNRRALRIFADCLSKDRWPGYSDEPALCGISGWAKKQIDDLIEKEAA